MKNFIENSYVKGSTIQKKSQFLQEFQLKQSSKSIKTTRQSNNNEKITNYGRFVSTNKNKSKISNSLELNHYYFSKSKKSSSLSTKESINTSMVDINSNCTDRITYHKQEEFISKNEVPNKTEINSVALVKNVSFPEKEKMLIGSRRRYRSVDNEELQKVVKKKSNQSPSEIRATVNRWLKETLPTTVVDTGSSQILSNVKKTTQSKHKAIKPILLTNKIPNQLTKDFVKLEGCCRDLLTNSENFKDKTYYNAINFYKLLHSFYDSLKLIKPKSINVSGALEMSKSEKETYIGCELLDQEVNKFDRTSESDLSSIDVVTQSSINPENKPKSLPFNSTKTPNLRISDVENSQMKFYKNSNFSSSNKEKSFGKESKEPLQLNEDKTLIVELLNMPKVEIKSKCVVGVYKNFVEEQYVLTGFREITKNERTTLLRSELKHFNTSKGFINLTTNCLASSNDQNLISQMDQSVQTSDTESYDHSELNSLKIFKNVSSQTQSHNESFNFQNYSKVTENQEDELIETLSWQSDNLSDNELFYQLNDEIMSPVFFEGSVDCTDNEEIRRPNTFKAVGNLYDAKEEYKLHTVKNQNVLQQATTEYCCIPLFLINKDITEISCWTAHASKVKVLYNMAVENSNQYNLFKSSSLKNLANSKYIHRDNLGLLKVSNIYLSNKKKLPTKNTLPPCGPLGKFSKSCNQLPNKSDSNKNLSTLEINCKEIKESLKKDIPLPENLNNLYERLSKLQKMLEGIPESNLPSTMEAVDHLNSSESCSPDFNGKLDGHLTNVIEKEQCPTSLGDCHEKKEILEINLNQTNDDELKSSYLNNSKSSNPLFAPNELDLLKSKTIDDEPSDVTNSLSMLENLIDDFLLKNGLSNVSKI